MNESKFSLQSLLAAVALVCAALFAVGCGATLSPDGSTGLNGAGATTPRSSGAGVLQVGDLVKVDFSGPMISPQPHEEHIKDDGTISLYLLGPVKAAGKSTGQLQQEIRDLYVPRFYKNLNVTVKPADRFYFVGGEVKAPNRQLYLGPITLTGAIKSAGDFTDFANKRKVTLIRADGTVKTIDAIKAQQNPELDVPIYPGDRIDVPSRIF